MTQKLKQVNSIGSLIRLLKKDLSSYKGPVWYRGHGKRNWKLVPSQLRLRAVPNEMDLINQFKQNATLLVNPRPATLFDWLFLMQHHQIRTRLLDWTENPMVALYFAAKVAPNSDGMIWLLFPEELNKMSRLAKPGDPLVPYFDDQRLSIYGPESLASEKTTKLRPLAAIASRSTPRMQAQLSVFTISHRDKTPIEHLGNEKLVRSFVVPAKHKKHILKELALIGFGEFQLFPELPSIASMMRGPVR